MALINLVNGGNAIIDDCDIEIVSNEKWRCMYAGKYKRNTYATTSKGLLMHRVILGAKKGEEVDHVNGNGLDNRRCNLRICNRSQNSMNQRKQQRETSSIYKGVRKHNGGNWEVRIKINGKRIALGSFHNERDAAIAYNEGAIKYHGEFANLNEI